MRSWHTIPAISALQRDLDKKFPNRTRPDWILGDADHSARVSDHNPDSSGNVHAIDIRLGGGLNPTDVLNATVGDERVKYVIFNRKIYSRTYGWQARSYTGSNPHTTHIHVSFRYEPEHENNTAPFFEFHKKRTRPVAIDLSVVRDEFFKALGVKSGSVTENVHVKRLQRAMNQRLGANLVVDGRVGKATVNAWARWERGEEVPGLGRIKIPDRKSLAALLQAKWRMVL